MLQQSASMYEAFVQIVSAATTATAVTVTLHIACNTCTTITVCFLEMYVLPLQRGHQQSL
jgi:hypothetical protein